MSNHFVNSSRGGANITTEHITHSGTMHKIIDFGILRVALRVVVVAAALVLVLLFGRGAGIVIIAAALLRSLSIKHTAGTTTITHNALDTMSRVGVALGVALLLAVALDWWPVAQRWGVGEQPTCIVWEDGSRCAEWFGVLRLFTSRGWDPAVRFGSVVLGPWVMWVRVVSFVALPWMLWLPLLDTEWILRMEQVLAKVPEVGAAPLDIASVPSPHGMELRGVTRHEVKEEKKAVEYDSDLKIGGGK